jgi:tetraacyldisaccharide 4'-kinase
MLLDDAFQHRRGKAGLNILLTAYNSIYAEDLFFLQEILGNLRWGVRAGIVVVTKCPSDLSLKSQEQIRKKLNLEKTKAFIFHI